MNESASSATSQTEPRKCRLCGESLIPESLKCANCGEETGITPEQDRPHQSLVNRLRRQCDLLSLVWVGYVILKSIWLMQQPGRFQFLDVLWWSFWLMLPVYGLYILAFWPIALTLVIHAFLALGFAWDVFGNRAGDDLRERLLSRNAVLGLAAVIVYLVAFSAMSTRRKLIKRGINWKRYRRRPRKPLSFLFPHSPSN